MYNIYRPCKSLRAPRGSSSPHRSWQIPVGETHSPGPDSPPSPVKSYRIQNWRCPSQKRWDVHLRMCDRGRERDEEKRPWQGRSRPRGDVISWVLSHHPRTLWQPPRRLGGDGENLSTSSLDLALDLWTFELHFQGFCSFVCVIYSRWAESCFLESQLKPTPVTFKSWINLSCNFSCHINSPHAAVAQTGTQTC